jgi:hypothetical protein
MSIGDLLRQAGVPIESLTRIRLGSGLVGKTTWAAIAAIAVLGLIASRLSDPWILAGLGALVGVIFMTYLWKVMSFARDNPAAALLEGADLVQWQRGELAAKGIQFPPRQPSIEPPKALEQGDE